VNSIKKLHFFGNPHRDNLQTPLPIRLRSTVQKFCIKVVYYFTLLQIRLLDSTHSVIQIVIYIGHCAGDCSNLLKLNFLLLAVVCFAFANPGFCRNRSDLPVLQTQSQASKLVGEGNVSITGEVAHPGTYPLFQTKDGTHRKTPINLLEAISVAGGMTLPAEWRVCITRMNPPSKFTVLITPKNWKASKITLMANDVVVIHRKSTDGNSSDSYPFTDERSSKEFPHVRKEFRNLYDAF
jgi:hypothetical protein